MFILFSYIKDSKINSEEVENGVSSFKTFKTSIPNNACSTGKFAFSIQYNIKVAINLFAILGKNCLCVV